MKYESENLGKAGLVLILIIGVLSLNNNLDGTITGEVVSETCSTDIGCVNYQTELVQGECQLWQCLFHNTQITTTDLGDCRGLKEYTAACIDYSSYYEDVCLKAKQVEVCE